MTFRQSTSGVEIVNNALGLISESKTISSFDDPGHNATVARRWYKRVVARLLEMHHWGLATKRDSLVAVDNTRSAEWLYAYAAPDDMAFPVGVAFASGASTVSYYRGLAGLIAMVYGKPIFQLHNGTLFSNMTGDLEYVSYDITEADFNHTFEDIVTLMLASRFALEIAKDRDMSDDLAKQANNAINVAMTQNLNSGNRQYGNTVSEAELARGSLWGSSWDYFPLSPGY